MVQQRTNGVESSRKNNSFSTTSESTPLLASMRPTPLPVKAIVILCGMRMSEPIALSVIFPFVNQVSFSCAH